jgi:hypothetical protein
MDNKIKPFFCLYVITTKFLLLIINLGQKYDHPFKIFFFWGNKGAKAQKGKETTTLLVGGRKHP